MLDILPTLPPQQIISEYHKGLIMLIAVVVNNEIEKLGESLELFPEYRESKFSKEFLTNNNIMFVSLYKPHDKTTQKLQSVEPYIEGEFVYIVSAVEKTQEDYDLERQAKEQEIREKRNKLLIDCDWTQISDAPVDNLAWAVYRQALRDITLQAGFPFTVDFPVNP